MKIGITFKPKITVALLLIVIVMNAFSMFILFPRVENIINVDLYEYGLKFSPEWFNPINDSSNLFVDSLGISLMLMIVAALTVMVYNRKRSAFTKAVSILLIAAGAGINLFSLYQFYLIDQIVNGKLYYYGLLIDGGWFANYKLYSLQLTGFVGFAIATAAVSIALIALSTRKSIDLVPESLANSILIISGTTFLALSILYTSSILAFLGLGMLFWGVIFTYVSNEEYVKKILLDTSTSSQMATANKVIQETDFAGNAVFLPPRYFKVAETYKVCIPKNKISSFPTPEVFYRRDPHSSVEFIEEPPAILITPPGAELVALFEKELKTDFLRENLHYLQVNLPRLLTENLEMSHSLEMDIEKDMIRIRIEGSVYRESKSDEQRDIYFSFGSPLTNAIACILSKVTGKKVTEVKRLSSPNGDDTIIEYRILEDEE